MLKFIQLLTMVMSVSVAQSAFACQNEARRAYDEYIREGGFERAVKEMGNLDREMSARGLSARVGEEYARELLGLSRTDGATIQAAVEVLYPLEDKSRERMEFEVVGPGEIRIVRYVWDDGVFGIGRRWKPFATVTVRPEGSVMQVEQQAGSLIFKHSFLKTGALVDRRLIFDNHETGHFELRMPMPFESFVGMYGERGCVVEATVR